MTDIFISYSRRDLEMVSILAQKLEESGYSVWWDVSGLHGGQAFAQVIEEKLAEAKCAIVVWSPDSVKSKWVNSEASFADNRGVLLTAVYRKAQAPMPFNNRHNENLRGWSGDVADDGFQKLLKAVERLCPEPSGSLMPATVNNRGTSEKLITPIASNTAQPLQNEAIGPSIFSIQKGLNIAGVGFLAVIGSMIAYQLLPTPITEEDKAARSKVYTLANDLTLLPIPAGSFEMGSDPGDITEKPVREVTINKPFWMSKTEITFDQYDAYVAAMGKEKPDDKGWGRNKRPVINVSWNDAQDYTQWLSKNNMKNLQCRLPSEAEWEYAARAGSKTRYHWGNKLEKKLASCSGCGNPTDSRRSSPVGSFPANDWGLKDMHGNVAEWVQDPWHENYDGAPTTGEIWEKDSDDRFRVVRGGSWLEQPFNMRVAYRKSHSPSVSQTSFGFRIVCSS